MPDAIVLDQYRIVITVGAFALFAIAAWLRQLGKRIDDGCPECAHCRELRRTRDERQAEINDWYASNLGLRDHPDVKRRWPIVDRRHGARWHLPARLRRGSARRRRADDHEGPRPQV